MTTRNLRPRATGALNVTPIAFTDETAPAVVGLTPRRTRDIVRQLGIRHTVAGRRIIVLVSDFVQALERAPSNAQAASAPVEDDQLESVDAVLARIGRKRTA